MCNTRGTQISNAIESVGLAVLNTGQTTRTSGNRQTAIDITLASLNIINRLLWRVERDPRGSDHHPIILEHDQSPPETTRRPRWMYHRADWSELQNQIGISCLISPPSSFEDFTMIILKAAEKSIPRTSSKPGRRALHWWSDDTKKAVKARRKALRTMQRATKRFPADHPDYLVACEQYRLKRNMCRQVIRDAKQNSWKDFIDGINANQSASELWSRVRALQGSRNYNGITLQLPNGPTQDPAIISETLGEYFADLSSLKRYPTKFKKNRRCLAQQSIPNPCSKQLCSPVD